MVGSGGIGAENEIGDHHLPQFFPLMGVARSLGVTNVEDDDSDQ